MSQDNCSNATDFMHKGLIMNMMPWTKALLLASSLTFAYACSDSDDNDDNPAPAVVGETTTPGSDSGNAVGTDTGGSTAATGSTAGTSGSGSGTAATPANPQTCEESWKQYVSARPAGLILGYSVASETKAADGTIIQQSTTSYEEQILESNDTRVLNKRTTVIPGLPQPNVAEVNFTKVEWLSNCSQVGTVLPELPVSSNLEIMEQSTKSVVVPAGTFTTNYVKGAVSDLGAGGTATFENWTLADGSSLLIKSTMSTSASIAGAAVLSNFTTELTKLVRP
ncbi:MAG: hypothetical protein EOP07_15985 [Proteobacteria bacterium]|nr:MAG: hypothetical protein EOP07_15985 [Pseudomonadota bacterium]